MNILEGLRVALRRLASNKMRTALTMLGMIIGVGAGVGLFFGIYPATKASGLHPFEALRFE